MSEAVLTPRPKPLTNLDLTVPETALKRVATPASIDFGAPNRLFNPMPWQKKADETLIRGDKVGPTAAVVTNLTPLYLRLTLDQVTVSDAGPKYVIGVEKQAAANPRERVKKQAYCKLNDKNDTFTLVEIKGKPEEPTAVVVMLNDTGERVTITREQPYRRVDGYMADLRYPPGLVEVDGLDLLLQAAARIQPSLAAAGQRKSVDGSAEAGFDGGAVGADQRRAGGGAPDEQRDEQADWRQQRAKTRFRHGSPRRASK